MPDMLLASSATLPDKSQLYGFALVGADLVLNNQGLSEYGALTPGHDGAYVSVSETGSGSFIVGTDDAGYGKVYVYRDGSNWALSRSLSSLASYASRQKWKLTPDEVELAALNLRPLLIAQQLTTSYTAYKEIRLLSPRQEATVKSDRSLHLHRRPRPIDTDYRTALSAGVSQFVGRLATIMSADIPMVSDISGGRDSRTVLAALRYAATQAHLSQHVRFRSNARKPLDYAVAKRLAKLGSFALNQAPQASSQQRQPEAAYNLWRAHDLGVYNPVYPAARIESEIALSGAAGGAHRGVYQGSALPDSLRMAQSPAVSNAAMDTLIDRALLDASSEDSSADPQLAHFRLFRNRIHGGRNSLRNISLAPLASQFLVRASNLLSENDIQRAQFYADIMFNLAPDLAREPYDSKSKNWTERHLERISIVEIGPMAEGGNVYGRSGVTSVHEVDPNPNADHIQPYRERFFAAREIVARSGIVDDVEIRRADASLAEASRSYFAHAVDAIPLAQVLHITEVLRNCGLEK